MLTYFFSDEAATYQFAARLALICPEQCVIFLKGEIGSGKTTLVRGLLSALGCSSLVKSPTYTLVESYDLSKKQVFHLDLYRLKDAFELEELGIRDYLGQKALWLIEWPEQGLLYLPKPDLVGCLTFLSDGRQFNLYPESERGVMMVEQLCRR